MRTEVIVVAGGAGRRLKAGMAKALVPIATRPLLAYCLKVFDAHPLIDGIILVGVKAQLKKFEGIAREYKKVRAVVAGGPQRSDSVKCGLKALWPDTKIVLVHDAARPLIDRAMVDRLLVTLRKHKAAIVGVPVKCTIKKVDRVSFVIQDTLERDLLWEAQTPQGFHKEILVRAHESALPGEATDDALLVERMGGKVKMVMGDNRNIKITTPEDILLAEQMLRGGP